MSLLRNEQEVKDKILDFLRKKYSCVVKENFPLFSNFAPDYYIEQRNKRKRVVFFRNPPDFPKVMSQEIKEASSKGIGVYIAIHDNENSPLFEKLRLDCEEHGSGIIYCDEDLKIKILKPALIDLPMEKIIEGRPKFFLSSKLWTVERETIRSIMKKKQYQPICVERLSNQEPLLKECYKRIDQCRFFVGIITSYSEFVEKEIRYAFKKGLVCLIYVKVDCFEQKKGKLMHLISFVTKKCTYYKFNSEKDLIKKVPPHLADVINKNIKI